MFKLPSFVKTPQHKRFDFKTRYYDAEKEAFNERIGRIKNNQGQELSEADAIKQRIRDQFGRKRDRKNLSGRTSNLRIALLICVLTALTYLILK